MEFKIVEGKITVNYIVIGGCKFRVGTFLGILSDLEGTQNLYNEIISRENKIWEYLESINLIGKSVRGLYFCRDEKKRNELYTEIVSSMEKKIINE